MTSAARLYTPEMLALAASLADLPIDLAMPLGGRARSASCGSSLELSLAVDNQARISRVGMRAQACAVGQASAALFAAGAVGKTRAEIADAANALARWLNGEQEAPDWPGLDTISAAAALPARRGAIMLAWLAALDALAPLPLPTDENCR